MKTQSCVSLILIGLAGVLCSAATPRAQTDRQILDEMAAMSEPERARLKKNQERFQKMSPQQQAHYRQLAEEIAGTSELRQTMETYFRWADRLPDPYARASLAQLTDPSKRMVRVAQLVADQQREMTRGHDMLELQFEHLLRLDGSQMHRYMPFLHDLPVLSEAEFDKLLNIIVESTKLPEAKRRELSALPTTKRAVQVLSLSTQATDDADTLAGTANTVSAGWPDDKLLQRLIEQEDDLELRWPRGWDERFRSGRNEAMKVISQRRIQLFFIKNLLAFETLRLLKTYQPAEAELSAFIARQSDEELKRPERDETTEQHRAEVILTYLVETKPDQIKTVFDDPLMLQVLADWKRHFDRFGEEMLRGGGREGREDRGFGRPGGPPGSNERRPPFGPFGQPPGEPSL